VRIEEYPPQEPFSEVGKRYHDEAMRLGTGITGEDHRYGDDPYQGVALYRPAKPNGRVLAFLHGGGWTNGYKEWMAFMAPAFTGAGYLFASIGYRLAPQHVFPTGVEDAAAGLAWVWRETGRKPIFIGGHSAGGHYTSLLAVTRDWQARQGITGDAIRGCLPLSGVYDFAAGSGLSMRPRFLGTGDTDRAASPIHRIDGRPRPFFMAHGERDFPHLIRQAEAMEAALKAAGGEVLRVVLPGRDHFTASYAGGEPAGPWVPAAIDWMNNQT
jgi:acetyl esterase/lipase